MRGGIAVASRVEIDAGEVHPLLDLPLGVMVPARHAQRELERAPRSAVVAGVHLRDSGLVQSNRTIRTIALLLEQTSCLLCIPDRRAVIAGIGFTRRLLHQALLRNEL